MKDSIDMYVLLFAVPDRNAAELESILDTTNYIIHYEGDNLYRLYYKYYKNFRDVILDIASIMYHNPEKVYTHPRNKISSCLLKIEIGDRFGYVYNVNSAFGLMIHEKTNLKEQEI
jgi:hypothetical protein